MVKAQMKRVDELATPFFKLCISSSVIDLTTLFTNYFGAMFPKFGFFSDFYLELDGIYGHIYFSSPGMWLGYRLRIAIALQFIPGLCIGMFTFFNTTVLVVNENGGVVPKFVNDLFACINPYLLWIFSDSLRKYVLFKLGLRKHGSGITTGVPRLTMQSVVPVS
ncbi:hypothetical protein GCK72_012222 [Caenorhabditis remanei]|uniref:Uncharacterized protein n=1 Tax=Caenorhabditis remanei TaxID=31234 RepID=A0A6A5GMM3_CAERE|nr:hypothetical protein GCK72_012222 [Caenorhabditis remanei]KAF1755772.1 hypothetical protein GCK72_012222 [Caenorhabditis remanei]